MALEQQSQLRSLMFELWRGIRKPREEPTKQGEQQREKVDLELLAAGEPLVKDTKFCDGGPAYVGLHVARQSGVVREFGRVRKEPTHGWC